MAAWTTTPRTWSVGETVTAANMNAQLRDFANAFGTWASYTPTWTASTTSPTNTTLVGAYMQVQKTITFRAQGTAAASFTAGSGAYSVAIPAAATSASNQVVPGLVFDSSSGFYYRGIGHIVSSQSTIGRGAFVDGAGSTAGFSNTVPMTWAVSDMWEFTGTYEAA